VLGEEGVGIHPSSESSKEVMLAMASCSAYEQKLVSKINTHLFVTKRKLCLHDGTVTAGPDKNRLVEVLPSKHIQRNHHTQRRDVLYANSACAIGRSEP